MDVACLTQLPAVPAEISRLLDEVYRVLKPGGKVLALAPALYDVDFWSRVLYPWKRWLVSREASHDQPRYTARQLKNHFARFVEHRVHKRHLRRGDVPHIWRLLPSSVLERLVGRCLVVKAFKPLSAAIPTALAA
jgi:SAM-dependent methyltransferase